MPKISKNKRPENGLVSMVPIQIVTPPCSQLVKTPTPQVKRKKLHSFGKGKVIHSQAREIIANVIEFMKSEGELFHQTRQFKIPLQNYRQRIVAATGISNNTYRNIMKEAEAVASGKKSRISSPRHKGGVEEDIEKVFVKSELEDAEKSTNNLIEMRNAEPYFVCSDDKKEFENGTVGTNTNLNLGQNFFNPSGGFLIVQNGQQFLHIKKEENCGQTKFQGQDSPFAGYIILPQASTAIKQEPNS